MLEPLSATLMTTFPVDPDPWVDPTLADDGQGGTVLVASSDGGDVRRWDTGTGELLWHFQGTDLISTVTVAHPPGRDPVVAVATDMGVLRLDAVTGTAIPDDDMAEIDTIWDIASGLLPDGRAYIAGAAQCEGLVHHWDAATGQPLGPCPPATSGRS